MGSSPAAESRIGLTVTSSLRACGCVHEAVGETPHLHQRAIADPVAPPFRPPGWFGWKVCGCEMPWRAPARGRCILATVWTSPAAASNPCRPESAIAVRPGNGIPTTAAATRLVRTTPARASLR